MRIGSLWIHDKDKKKVISGEIASDIGINLNSGQRLICKLVKNDKKQQGDKYPDFYIEAWLPKDKPNQAPSQPEDDIEF